MTFQKDHRGKRQRREHRGAERRESDTKPTTTRITNITTGPMIGKKFSVAASAPSPAGLGMPNTAQMMPVAAPTPRLIAVTVSR